MRKFISIATTTSGAANTAARSNLKSIAALQNTSTKKSAMLMIENWCVFPLNDFQIGTFPTDTYPGLLIMAEKTTNCKPGKPGHVCRPVGRQTHSYTKNKISLVCISNKIQPNHFMIIYHYENMTVKMTLKNPE